MSSIWRYDRSIREARAMENKLKHLIENAPKPLNRDFLKQVYITLYSNEIENITDSEEISNSLAVFILNDETKPLDRCLATYILRKLSPQPDFIEIVKNCKLSQLLYCVPLFAVQNGNDPGMKEILHKLVNAIKDEKIGKQNQWHVLTAFLQILMNNYSLIPNEVKTLTTVLPYWLNESVFLGGSKTHSKKSDILVYELDGSLSQEFFTILSCAQYYTPDYFLNIQVFSMLQQWLLTVCGKNSVNKNTAFSLNILPTETTACIREYCLRIIEQYQRKHNNPYVVNFQTSCLVEGIGILDILCYANPDLVHSVLPAFRSVYNQLCNQVMYKFVPHDVSAITAAAQFFINHSSAIIHKPDDVYPFIFCELLGICYHDNLAAFEIITTIKRNLAQLCYHTSVLEKYFPTIFKILAWNPSSFLEDFQVLLPTFMSQQTSVEIFHTLLDLPCVTASLLISQKFSSSKEVTLQKKSPLIEPSVVELYSNPTLQPMFQFILRPTSGVGDTFERISILHQAILPLVKHPQVVQCAKASIVLLQDFFSTFLQFADSHLVGLLFCTLLERVSTIYPVSEYAESVYEILAKMEIQMFSLHPELIIHGKNEIVDFLSNLKNFKTTPQLFINLVWIVGEYVSLTYSELCRPEVITYYYESFESTVYEMIGCSQTDEMFMKLINISLATLSKLSARCQDLVPRAILCLSKAGQQLSMKEKSSKAQHIVYERINELLTMLRTPNVASAILSPSKEIDNGRWHRDPTSLPFTLRTITNILACKEEI